MQVAVLALTDDERAAFLLGLLQPWPCGSHAVAIDATPLHARGGVWHTKLRLTRRILETPR